MKLRNSLIFILALILALCLAFSGCESSGFPDFDGGDVFAENTPSKNDKGTQKATQKDTQKDTQKETVIDTAGTPDDVKAYSGSPYVVLNGNQPEFKSDEITDKAYEFYSELDTLGRCGYTMACVGKELMPTEDRESISSVKPTGWVNNKYDTKLVDGGYIYNRCHLIGFQLTGENARKNNLITGTRYMNVTGMLPFENMVADYIKETGNHVMYRVTPIFVGNNLVASGVQMEAYSVEDNGDGICFNVYVYNVQPGITINYATGENWLSTDTPTQTESVATSDTADGNSDNKYILNTNNKKIHKVTCTYAKSISEANRREHTGLLDDLLTQGYTGCGTCLPLG